MAALTYISLFSGVGSCALASRDLGWRPVAFAEVDPFASAVLEHRFPNVPNVGDVTAYDWSRFRRQVDLVCGGPPCQPFSVAGDRGSLDDARGNLSLEYINAIDAIDPRFSLTENVPGWLSTKDNAFGVFLGKLVGSDSPLVPGRGQRWTNAGVVAGPKRLAAWRILDAQHYGVPQRRRRVFVLTVRIGDRFSPEQILFESESLPGDTPALRGAQEDVAGTLGGGTSGGGPKPDTDRMTFVPHTAGCVTPGAHPGSYNGQDAYNDLLIPQEATSFKASHYTRDKDGAPSTVVPPLSADADKGDQDTLILAPWSPELADPITAHEARTYTHGRAGGRNLETSDDVAYALTNPGEGGRSESRQVLDPSMQVRRLTPLECERLQGEPDFWTLVPYRGKPASDSVRYRAIGNAWAIPVLEWIFRRLDLVDKCLELDQRQPVRSQEVDTHTSQASDERGRVPAGKGRCVD